MEKSDYIIKDIYQGGYSSLDPEKSLSPSNYPVLAGSFGLTTDPRSANVLKEVSSKLSSGVKQIEVEGVSPEVFESIPNDQLKEVNRLSKLTGVDLSMHGPVVDSTGITQQGFSEQNREVSERRFVQTIERAHILNPDGNIIVNFHSAEGIPGSEFEWDKEGKRKAKKLIVVNRETGKLAPLEPETKYYADQGLMKGFKPDVSLEQIKKARSGKLKESEIKKLRETVLLEEGKPGKIIIPEERIEILNHSEWDNSISQLLFNKERADEILQRNAPLIAHIEKDLSSGNISSETLSQFPEQRQAYDHYSNAKAYLEDTNQQLQALFSMAWEFGNKRQRRILKEMSDGYQKQLDQDGKSIVNQSQAMQNLIQGLKAPELGLAPEMYMPIEEFAKDQSSKTFGNTAFEAYKKFGDKAPIVSIENPPAGFALSTGEDIRDLVEKSREQFIKKAEEEGMSKSVAKEQAEKLIGATWDVGHINMLRKQGASEEDILRETEKIKPLLKHVHLSDNFGFEHTELPMGMGNVPIKEIMEKLGKKGFEAKKIIEAGNWWQHFQTSPVQQTMEAFGSPIYSMQMAPYWNQSLGFTQGYFGGYGAMLPDINYQTFGAGFSQLPQELGGQKPGAGGGRMSGRPME